MRTIRCIVITALCAALIIPQAYARSARLHPGDISAYSSIIIDTQKKDRGIKNNITVRAGDVPGMKGGLDDWKVSGGTITLRPEGDLVITLPASGALRSLRMDVFSGNIRVDGLSGLEYLVTAATTGTTTIRNTSASERIDSSSTKGRIIFESVDSGHIEANSVNGAIRFRGEADTLKLSSLLGRIDADSGMTPDITLSTTHGELSVRTSRRRPQIEFSTLFGIYYGPESTEEDPDLKIMANSLNSNLTVEIH